MSRAAPFSLEGKVAVVTGAGSGIGRATAIALAEMGATVVLTDQPGRGTSCSRVVASIRQAGGDAAAMELDVTSARSMPRLFDSIAEAHGGPHILVNNAGVQLFRDALEITEEEFDHILDVNLRGAFFCSQAAAQIMADNGGGTIINIASQHGVVGNRDRAPYCASKGGLINLARALAVEWAPLRIRVNTVSPTYVLTETNAQLLASAPFAEDIARNVPLGRAVTPEEVAAGVCYLASPAADGVTGHNLLIDGGWTAR